MINIVTWLDDAKYKNELATACARNDISIVASEFNTPAEFLQEFDAIDTHIDVLVISNSKIDKIDRKAFFEDVCVTEPNIRIVIVFPGYRNEYIEEQISEYKAQGIFEIIYEGQGLDAQCFVEVIKKGYIYDYEVNVYNEPHEIVKPLTPSPVCKTIGVLGLTHGCGVTNMAISIAEYIAAAENCNVKAIDFSGTGSMRLAKSKKVTYIVHSDIDVNRLKRTSRAIIYDFGTPFNISAKGKLLSTNECFSEEKIKMFRECDLKICMGYADDWHIGKMKYLLNDKAWKWELNDSYVFLLDTVPQKFKAKHSKINIFSRNERVVSDRVADIFAERGGG